MTLRPVALVAAVLLLLLFVEVAWAGEGGDAGGGGIGGSSAEEQGAILSPPGSGGSSSKPAAARPALPAVAFVLASLISVSCAAAKKKAVKKGIPPLMFTMGIVGMAVCFGLPCLRLCRRTEKVSPDNP